MTKVGGLPHSTRPDCIPGQGLVTLRRAFAAQRRGLAGAPVSRRPSPISLDAIALVVACNGLLALAIAHRYRVLSEDWAAWNTAAEAHATLAPRADLNRGTVGTIKGGAP